jgi:23S rRNA (adenine2503-C2)-methyltransferase
VPGVSLHALSVYRMSGLYELSLSEIGELLEVEPGYRARQVWEGLYERGERPEEMTALPGAIRQKLSLIPPALKEVACRTADRGETVKWLFELHDGRRIETVLMRYARRATVCVSSQAGCAMGCSFCATGQMGFQRHLSSGEIVEQVVVARRAALPRRLSNVVFMGMGEPLANYDRVWESVLRMNGDMGLSARHLTISTVGIVPGIRRLTEESLPVSLAVSLHAANDELRNSLVPVNRRYPIDVLTKACADYVTRTRRRLSFEWALIDGVNDNPRDAIELADLARPLRAHVNLIALNPTPGYLTRGSSPARVHAFKDSLETLGVNVTVRSTRGMDIDAACGQLSSSNAGTSTGAITLGRRSVE